MRVRRLLTVIAAAVVAAAFTAAPAGAQEGFEPCGFTLLINGTFDIGGGSFSGACVKIGPGGTILGAGEDSYLEDPLLRMTEDLTADLFFPVGDADSYRPIWIHATRDTTDDSTYISRVDPDEPPALGTRPDAVLGIDLERSWQAGLYAGPAATSRTVTLTFGDDDFGPAVDDVDEVRLLRLVDGEWTVVDATAEGTLDDGSITSAQPLADLAADQRFGLGFDPDELTFEEFRSLQEELITLDKVTSGPVRSLRIKLDRAERHYERGQEGVARNILRAYEHVLEAKRGKRSLTEYAYLVLDDGLELLPVTP